ncbi:MAG: stage II sporulation protein R [Clostridia bacterium]|nr:stage II sporulation protein R [Clostridia bacterium]
MDRRRAALRRFSAIPICLLLLAVLLADGVRILRTREKIRTDFLRLHVIAASDTPEDQRLKLAVRDAVLAAGASVFNGSVTADEAEKRIIPRAEALKNAAERVLRANGCADGVRVEVKKEYFPERQYGEYTLPPGVYRAVKVTIGAGEGHNWWCVMFPPMCLPESGIDARPTLDEAENELLANPGKYRIRFKAAEICEKLLGKLRDAFAGGADGNGTVR